MSVETGLIIVSAVLLTAGGVRLFWRRHTRRTAAVPPNCDVCGSTEFYSCYEEAQAAVASEVFRTGRTVVGNVRYLPDGRICRRCGLEVEELT